MFSLGSGHQRWKVETSRGCKSVEIVKPYDSNVP